MAYSPYMPSYQKIIWIIPVQYKKLKEIFKIFKIHHLNTEKLVKKMESRKAHLHCAIWPIFTPL